MTIKRLLSLLLALILVVGSFCSATIVGAATGSAKIVLSTEKEIYTVNDRFAVKVELASATEVAGLQFDLKYDKSLLTLVGVDYSAGVFDTVNYSTALTSPVKFMLTNADTTAHSGSGALFTLNFKVKSSVTHADTSVTLSSIVGYNNSLVKFAPTTNNAEFTVCSHKNREWKTISTATSPGGTGEKQDWCPDCKTVFNTVRTQYPMLQNVTWTIKNYFYTGKAITPSITGKYTDETGKTYTLKQNVDFKISSLSNNKKAGTAYVSVIAVAGGGYGGYKNDIPFKIVKASVSGIKATYAYKGSQIKPSVTVKVGSKTLKKNTDYTVTYSTNKKPGYGYVTIKGKGNYVGTIKKSFVILPGKPTWYKCYSSSSKKLTVAVKKNSSVTGYQFQVSLKKNFSSKKSYVSKSYKTYKKTFTGLKKGKYYYVRVRSYKTVGGAKKYGPWTTVKKVKVK